MAETVARRAAAYRGTLLTARARCHGAGSAGRSPPRGCPCWCPARRWPSRCTQCASQGAPGPRGSPTRAHLSCSASTAQSPTPTCARGLARMHSDCEERLGKGSTLPTGGST
eukprot:1183707-Prorocentrum_minimum.AAC.3